MNWSHYQIAIFEAIRRGDRSLRVKALAGSGKSTVLEECIAIELQERPSSKVVLVSFNKDIEVAMNARLERRGLGKLAKTCHAVGLAAWRGSLGEAGWELKVDRDKVRGIVDHVLTWPEKRKYPQVGRLVGLAKQVGLVPISVYGHHNGSPWSLQGLVSDIDDAWQDLIDHYGIDLDEVSVDCARRVLAESVAMAREVVDFDDMLYMPIVAGVAFEQYDVVFVDECFVGDTPILLDAKGKSMTIEKMYETQYRGPIMSWTYNKAVSSKVKGVRRVPVGKPMVRVLSRRRGYKRDGSRLSQVAERVKYGNRIVVCTSDHRFWTQRGWAPACELLSTDTLIHESVAPFDHHYTQKYKHSAQGRKALADKATIERFGRKHRISREKFNKLRGGNGKGLSRHEKLLAERLGVGWETHHVVPTGKKRGEGYPTCYKLDLANMDRKIAIEVDGHSHVKRKDQDAKKEALLRSKGWEVVRLSNREVRELNDELLHERVYNSPVEADVLLVEPWKNKNHLYVYDLEVEDTHCYFAHGVLVHNCQDLSGIQHEMIVRMMKGEGR